MFLYWLPSNSNFQGNYDPTDHQRQMEDYYKQYEEQRVCDLRIRLAEKFKLLKLMLILF